MRADNLNNSLLQSGVVCVVRGVWCGVVRGVVQNSCEWSQASVMLQQYNGPGSVYKYF